MVESAPRPGHADRAALENEMLPNRARKPYPLLLATLAGVVVFTPAAAAPAPSPGSAHPRIVHHEHMTLMSGTLSAPSLRAPREVARAFLAERPDMLGGADADALRLARSTALGRGHLLRYKQMHAGLEVIGGDTVVRVDQDGRVRWAASGARAMDADLALDPVLSGRDAIELVGRHAGYPGPVLAALDSARATRLVIYAQPAMAAPRLAYQVALPFDMQRMQKIRAYVDAETGLVYMREDLVRRQGQPTCPNDSLLAYVYEENPVATQALSCVSLSPYLSPGATTLANGDVVVENCIDNQGCRNVSGGSHHFCDLSAEARADAGGNFTAYTFNDDLEPEDAFAEVQMFYHVSKVYEKARSLGGFDGTNARPLSAIVNFRAPSFTAASECTGTTYGGSEDLEPFDNALFVPGGGLFGDFPAEDAIIFGQGTGGDFSYDGDVVYHEFGHAVMAAVSPELGFYGFDNYGIHVLGGAMHEGYADLMTMFVTDDPAIGEYAVQGLSSSGATEIRNLDNDATCPGSLIGEAHEDSLPFTGAMWQARQAVGTTPSAKDSFDRAVFAAQQGFGVFETFETAAQKTLMELEASMSASVAATVEGIFRARGLIGDPEQGTRACNGRVLDGSDTLGFLLVPGTDKIQLDKLPAAVQFRYQVPAQSSALELDIALSAADGTLFGPGDEAQQPDLIVVASAGETPVLWSLDQVGISGVYQHMAPITFEDVPDRPGIASGKATITGDFPPGAYHLQIVNQGPSWQLAQISLSHRTGAVPGEDGDGGGCGCTAGAHHDTRSALGSLALFALAALALGRRRLRRAAVRHVNR